MGIEIKARDVAMITQFEKDDLVCVVCGEGVGYPSYGGTDTIHSVQDCLEKMAERLGRLEGVLRQFSTIDDK